MTRKIFRLWGCLLILKLLFSAWLSLTPDEAYYWVWSQHLQLSYYDHPAMVAWLFYIGEPFLWLAQAVRWPAVILGHTTLLIWIQILRHEFSEKQKLAFLLLATASPMMGGGSLIVTPDLPLLFFWSSALLFLQLALSEKKAIWYGLLGAALGLGFCSKYHIVLFVPILLVWLTLEKRWRDVRWPYTALTFIVGLAFCTPVLYWNAANGFASFRFQLEHGLGGKQWNPSWTLEYVGGQIGLIFPFICALLIAGWKYIRRFWLVYFALGPLVFFFFTSFKGVVEANWPIAAYPSLLALAVMVAPRLRWGQTALIITLASWLAAGLLLVSNEVFSWLPTSTLAGRYEVMKEYRRLKYVANGYKPLYAGNYQLASILSFETQRSIYKARGFSRRDFFDELPQSLPSEYVYFVIIEKEQRLPQNLQDLGHQIVNKFKIDHHHYLIEVRRE